MLISLLVIVCITIIEIVILKSKLNTLIRKIDRFERPSLNEDIALTVLCMCLCSCLVGTALTMIMLL